MATVSPGASLVVWGGIHVPPQPVTSWLTLSLCLLSSFFRANWSHCGETPTVCTPGGARSSGDTLLGVFGDHRWTGTRGQDEGGGWEWSPRERGGGVGFGVGVVPQFPHCGEGPGAAPTRGHQRAVRPHVTPVPSCATPSPRCEAPPYPDVPGATPGPAATADPTGVGVTFG